MNKHFSVVSQPILAGSDIEHAMERRSAVYDGMMDVITSKVSKMILLKAGNIFRYTQTDDRREKRRDWS